MGDELKEQTESARTPFHITADLKRNNNKKVIPDTKGAISPSAINCLLCHIFAIIQIQKAHLLMLPYKAALQSAVSL